MNDDTANDRSFIEHLHETIARHLNDEQFGVEMLARELGVSKSQLHRKLQLHFGKSASKLIREARLKKAKDLLENEKYTVAEVAYQVGFSSDSYFNTCFYEFYGYTPGEAKIRQSLKNKKKNIFSKKNTWLSFGILLLLVIISITFRFIPVNLKQTSKTAGNTTPEEPYDPLLDKSIAVIPFHTLSQDQEDDYFSKGMVYAIRDHLYKVGDLHVISDILSERIHSRELSPFELGKALGSSYILTGSVLLAGDIVRITPQLTDSRTNQLIWSDTYTGDLSNVSEIITIQSEVAKKVALGCKAMITDKTDELFSSGTMTQNTLAYKYYLKGLDYWSSKADRILALEMFSRSIREDSTFAAAYARRAVMHANVYDLKRVDNWLEHDQMALDNIKKADQLDPESIEVKIAHAVYNCHIARDYERAISILNELKEDLPNMAELYAYVADNKRRQGIWQEAIRELKRAVQQEPFNVVYIANLCKYYVNIRNFDLSIETVNNGLDKNPDSRELRQSMFYVTRKKTGDLSLAVKESGLSEKDLQREFYYYSGQFDKLIEYFHKEGEGLNRQHYYYPKNYLLALYYHYSSDTVLSKTYADSAIHFLKAKLKENPIDIRLYPPLGRSYGIIGEKEKAIAYSKKAIELMPVEVDAPYGIALEYELVFTYVLIGEYDLAMDRIEYLLSVPGWLCIGDLKLRPEFDELRKLTRFQEIISSAKGKGFE